MKNREITLKDLADTVLPKLWLILLISAICAGVMFAYSSFFKDDTYTSTSSMLVYSKNSNEATSGTVDVAKGMVKLYKVILESDKCLVPIANSLESNYAGLSASGIRSMMSIVQIEDTEAFKISVTAPSQDMAYDILSKIVENAPELIDDVFPNAFKVSFIDPPAKPLYANSKNTYRNAIVVFFAVSVALLAVAWIFSFFDVTVRDKKKIEDNLAVPVLGVIPKHDLPIEKGDDVNV